MVGLSSLSANAALHKRAGMLRAYVSTASDKPPAATIENNVCNEGATE